MVESNQKVRLGGIYSASRNERAVSVREELIAWLFEVDGGSVDEITRTEEYAVMRLRPTTADVVSSVRLALEGDQIRHRLGFTARDVEQHDDEIFVRVPWPDEV